MKRKKGKSRSEIVSLAVALALLIALLGTLVRMSLQEEKPPSFSVSLAQAREEGGMFYLPFTVSNDGTRTAREVVVRASNGNGGETAEAIFDYLPGKSSEEGSFVFHTLPQNPDVRVVSFQNPP